MISYPNGRTNSRRITGNTEDGWKPRSSVESKSDDFDFQLASELSVIFKRCALSTTSNIDVIWKLK